MLFNSAVFAIFFPIVLTIYWLLRTPRRQNAFLVVASLFFYGWWDWRFLSLIILSTLVDWGCALRIERTRADGGRGRRWLAASVFVNLGALGIFKYFNFFMESLLPIWSRLGWEPGTLQVILPVGISFYTFQTMSYTIDVYKGQLDARRSLTDVAAYVTFFPQLVAGPIERAGRLLPQLEAVRSVSARGVRLGLLLIFTGFVKKLLIADGIAPITDGIFGKVALGQEVSSGDLLMGAYLFTFQIYGDFSGYSDIARGLARLLGIDLMVNFRQPLFAWSITNLWRRWHISLSTWLRDYLYISLGGNRGGSLWTYRNLMLTMLIGGLWHGAAWTFVVWGGLHGLFLVVERLTGIGGREGPNRVAVVIRMIVTFHLTVLAFVFFRADSFHTAWVFVREVATIDALPGLVPTLAVLGSGFLIILVDLPHLRAPKEELPLVDRPIWLAVTIAAFAVGLYLAPPLASQSFIYFQF